MKIFDIKIYEPKHRLLTHKKGIYDKSEKVC